MGNLLTQVALLAWHQPAGFHCRMLSTLQRLDQVQSLCGLCCAGLHCRMLSTLQHLGQVQSLCGPCCAGFHCRMLSTLQRLGQVQSLCGPCCAVKSEQLSLHNYIYLLHSDLPLSFLFLHKDAATQFTDTNLWPTSHPFIKHNSVSAVYTDLWQCKQHAKNLYMSIQLNIFDLQWLTWRLFNKAYLLSMDNKLTHTKNVQHTNPDVTAVTNTCDIDKQQYFVLHTTLLTLKQKVWEEQLVNLTGNNRN